MALPVSGQFTPPPHRQVLAPSCGFQRSIQKGLFSPPFLQNSSAPCGCSTGSRGSHRTRKRQLRKEGHHPEATGSRQGPVIRAIPSALPQTLQDRPSGWYQESSPGFLLQTLAEASRSLQDSPKSFQSLSQSHRREAAGSETTKEHEAGRA